MESKVCSKCKKEKSIECFSIRSDTKKPRKQCKECRLEYMQQYDKKNAEKIKLRRKKHRSENYEEYLKKEKECRHRNRHKRREYDKMYKEKNKERIKAYHKEYREKNKRTISEKRKKTYKIKRKDILKKQKETYYKCHEYSRSVKNNYHKRRLTDVEYRLRCSVRSRLSHYIKTSCGNSKLSLIGCSIKFLKQYLEEMFVEGMSWENYGEWHIDHIKPLASFDLTDKDQLLKACHYTNLQPLWAKDNLRKGAKISEEFGNA